MSERLTYAIGDIHGRLDCLTRAFALIADHAGERGADIVCLGDYVDRGPDSKGVVDLLMAGPARGGDTLTCLRGNHEAMMLECLAEPSKMNWWLGNGGGATLHSYGGDVPGEHLNWLAGLQDALLVHGRFFVHAGVRPGVALEEQDPEEILWIRDLFLNSSADFGAHVVHGHTPREEPELRANRTNLDTGAFYTGRLSIGVFAPNSPGGPIEVLTAAPVDVTEPA